MVEEEARMLSSSSMMRVFGHLYLQDTNFDFGALLEPVDPESYATVAEAVKGQVEALLKKFLAFDTVARAESKDESDIIDDGAPKAGDDDVQG